MLHLHTFGRPHVRSDDGVLAGAAGQPRRLAILALLASAGESGLTRDKLVAYLWPDAEEERARRGLNQAVYALRQELGADDALLGARELRLNPERVTSDVGEFAGALKAGKLETAVAHYTGAFLDGFHLTGAPEFERWAEEERADLAHRYAAALEKLARQAAERGEHREAVGWWRKLAGQDPLNAHVAVNLMRALVAAGDRAGAVQHARVYEVLMEQELDAPPDRQVVLLAEELRRGDSDPVAVHAVTAAAPEPTVVAPVSLPPPASPPSSPSPPTSADPGPVTGRRPGLRDAVVAGGILAAGIAAGLLLRRPATLDVVPGPATRVAFDDRLELDPAISPDGHTIAYAAEADDRFQIFVRRRDGGPALAVSAALPGSHRRPAWSPDGSRLAFQAEGTIYVVPALGGTPQLLVRPSRPGRWVAYPAWSPDGRSIAYAENWSIYVRAVDGGAQRLVTSRLPAHTLSWSPDGRWISFVSGNPTFLYGETPWGNETSLGNLAPSAVWLVRAGGGQPVAITDAEALNTGPVWLPGARGLLFVSSRDGGRDVYQVDVGPDGRPVGPARRLTTGLGVHSISVSADASILAYSVFNYTGNIWSVPIPARGSATLADARPITEGTQAIEGIVVSPDGRSLAFDSDRDGNQDVYRLPLEGGDPVRLTSSLEDEFVTSWSADGRELALHQYHGGARRVQVIPVDGGPARDVAVGPVNQRSPGFAPDGGLVFTAEVDGGRRLFAVARTGDSTWGPPRQLTRVESWGGRWAPDGRTIVHCRPDGLWLMAADGSNARRLVAGGDSTIPSPELALWSRDGRTIYFKAFDRGGRSSFWAVPAAGGAPRLLLRFDDPAHPSSRAEFATDGRRLFFTVGARQSDVWAMELRTPS